MFTGLVKAVLSRRRADLHRRRYHPRIEPCEVRCLLAVTITEFAVPTPPMGITSGPDGNLWYTAFTPDHSSRTIGRITPSGMVIEFPLPATDLAGQIVRGADGNLWFDDGTAIGRITPTGSITEFPISITLTTGVVTSATIEGIALGPDGNVWFTQFGNAAQIGNITPAGSITGFPFHDYVVPIHIATGPDGNLWFDFSLTSNMQRITPTGMLLPQFSLDQRGGQISRQFAFDANGDLWAPLSPGAITGPALARRTPSGTVTLFSGFSSQTSPAFGLSNVTLGPDGNMWFVDQNAVGQVTPGGTVREFAAPRNDEPESSVITTGPDGNLWYTEPSTKKIARVHIEAESPTQRFVEQVYADLLHRSPDPGGLAIFMNLIDQGGVSRSQVVLAIENSQEYRTDSIVDVYHRFLQRSPDPTGLTGWLDFLGQGGTRSDLEAMILSSPEYQTRRGGSTKAGFLEAVYQDVLGRAPEPSGLAFWNQILAKEDADEPVSASQIRAVATSILSSSEATQDQVQSWYNQFLHRSADPMGLNALSLALEQGLTEEQALAVLLGSAEYFANA